MKKTILTVILCGFIVLGLTGCGNNNKFDVGEKSNIQISDKGIKLSIKEGTLTKTGVTLILKNDSDVDVEYGEPYEIEIKEDKEWHKIDVELYFNLPAYKLKPKEFKEIELNWENDYGKLAPGEYRIIKDVSILKENNKFEQIYVSTEFSIK